MSTTYAQLIGHRARIPFLYLFPYAFIALKCDGVVAFADTEAIDVNPRSFKSEPTASTFYSFTLPANKGNCVYCI
jgi:hypothetical protein